MLWCTTSPNLQAGAAGVLWSFSDSSMDPLVPPESLQATLSPQSCCRGSRGGQDRASALNRDCVPLGLVRLVDRGGEKTRGEALGALTAMMRNSLILKEKAREASALESFLGLLRDRNGSYSELEHVVRGITMLVERNSQAQETVGDDKAFDTLIQLCGNGKNLPASLQAASATCLKECCIDQENSVQFRIKLGIPRLIRMLDPNPNPSPNPNWGFRGSFGCLIQETLTYPQ